MLICRIFHENNCRVHESPDVNVSLTQRLIMVVYGLAVQLQDLHKSFMLSNLNFNNKGSLVDLDFYYSYVGNFYFNREEGKNCFHKQFQDQVILYYWSIEKFTHRDMYIRYMNYIWYMQYNISTIYKRQYKLSYVWRKDLQICSCI